jgi:hypothetical protein
VQRNLCPVRNRQQSTFACLWRLLATYARCASATFAFGYATHRQQGTLARALRAQPFLLFPPLLLRSGHKLLALLPLRC